MPGNRSLDEFVAEDEPDDAPEPTVDPDPESADQAGDDGRADPEPDGDDPAVEPMAETFAWSAHGGTCAGCGDLVDVRWRDGDELVCAECKAW